MADKIDVLISEEDVNKRIRELGETITKDYNGAPITVICTLKGAAPFACELIKRIDLPVELEFMRVSSYGNASESSGVVKIVQDLDAPIEGKDVLIVEDIIDSGNTMSYLMKMLAVRKPKSLKLCSLLDKPDRRVAPVNIDYKGFEIPDVFVVGYGLDYAQKYRNLPFVGEVKEI
ncbi:MAG: hypoxanthine phosphoribosyltransferase [Lachnospiraceae bacterium]|nr:hypoxanthine phosphoribosyltransferase [Lachnospiraceae bacterium]